MASLSPVEKRLQEDQVFPQQVSPSLGRRALNEQARVSLGANQLRAVTQGDPDTEVKERTEALGDQLY